MFFCEFLKSLVLWAHHPIFFAFAFCIKIFCHLYFMFLKCQGLFGKKPAILVVCNVSFCVSSLTGTDKWKISLVTLFYEATTFVNPISLWFCTWSIRKKKHNSLITPTLLKKFEYPSVLMLAVSRLIYLKTSNELFSFWNHACFGNIIYSIQL